MDNTNPGPSNQDSLVLEEQLTNKFLSGELSFAEYSNEWYGNDDEEVDNEENEETIKSEGKVLQTELKKIRRRGLKLTPGLLGLMGEANLRFARGELDVAEKMCHEIIKRVPTVAEPYETLAQIYENDPEKSMQFSLLAAHLNPPNATEWLRLAALSRQRNDLRQEMLCYTQAIKADPTNLDIHLKRLEIVDAVEKLNVPSYKRFHSRVRCLHKIVASLSANQGEEVMKYMKIAMSLYKNSNETEHAREVMTLAYKKCSSLFSPEDINIYLELLIMDKLYQTCIEVFVAELGVEIEAEIQTVRNTNNEIEEQTNYLNCTIPNNLPIDLRSKLLICFIHLGASNLVHTMVKDFLNNDVEKAGDLFMDIEEALSSVGLHEWALLMLDPLVKNPNFNLGAVWLKHAECLYKLGREEEAVHSYYKVLEHVPQHSTARHKLYTMLEKKGKIDDALKILQQNYKYVVSAKLLYEQCQILKSYERWDKYLEIGEALLSKHFTKYRHLEEIKLASQVKAGIDVIQEFRSIRGEKIYNDDDLHFDDDEGFKLSADEEWDLFTDLLKVSLKHKNYTAMERLAYGAFTSKALSPRRAEIEFYCVQASLLNKNYHIALKFVRDMSAKYATPFIWNILMLVMNLQDTNQYIKFLTRHFGKESNVVKYLFLGCNFLVSGRYLIALKYFMEYHDKCREPLSALLIAITVLVMAAQRTLDKHHHLVLQGISYMLTYQNLRKCDQESLYNLGRAYHMLNINNLAIEYYERALACGPVAVCDVHGSIDVTRETAYNLCILYKDHSPALAKKIMMKYLTI